MKNIGHDARDSVLEAILTEKYIKYNITVYKQSIVDKVYEGRWLLWLRSLEPIIVSEICSLLSNRILRDGEKSKVRNLTCYCINTMKKK